MEAVGEMGKVQHQWPVLMVEELDGVAEETRKGNELIKKL